MTKEMLYSGRVMCIWWEHSGVNVNETPLADLHL